MGLISQAHPKRGMWTSGATRGCDPGRVGRGPVWGGACLHFGDVWSTILQSQGQVDVVEICRSRRAREELGLNNLRALSRVGWNTMVSC